MKILIQYKNSSEKFVTSACISSLSLLLLSADEIWVEQVCGNYLPFITKSTNTIMSAADGFAWIMSAELVKFAQLDLYWPPQLSTRRYDIE